MILYPKIPGPFKRHTEGPDRNKFIPWAWSSAELESLFDYTGWVFTEKVDGTNVRVHWDGHEVRFGGRTDAAQMPVKLLQILQELFPEYLLEQEFKDTEVTLFGEGYGAGIQSGGVYRPDPSFILFDVKIGNWWLLRDNVVDIGSKLGIPVVPQVLLSLHLDETIHIMGSKPVESHVAQTPGVMAEGLVGVTDLGLLDRAGNRITVKLKTKDLEGLNLDAT
jgi:hypothetical protein